MENFLATFFSLSFALSDKHSKRVRDLHLLKNLSAVLDKAKLGQGKKTEHVTVKNVVQTHLSSFCGKLRCSHACDVTKDTEK